MVLLYNGFSKFIDGLINMQILSVVLLLGIIS